MEESNSRVVYLDETVFTFSTFRSKSWAHRRDRIKVIDSDLRVKRLALIAAISEDGGLIDYAIHPRAINTEFFVAFIRQLSLKLGGDDYALFLDNLSVHKTREAKLIYKDLTSQRSSKFHIVLNSTATRATFPKSKPHTRSFFWDK